MILDTFADNGELLTALFPELPEAQRSQVALLLGTAEVLFFDSCDDGWRQEYQALTRDRVVHVEASRPSGSGEFRWSVAARPLRDVSQVAPYGTTGHLSLSFTELRSTPGSGHLLSLRLGYTKPVPATVVDLLFAR